MPETALRAQGVLGIRNKKQGKGKKICPVKEA